MVKARKYVIRRYFEGAPKQSDFEIVEHELPPLKEGELLVKAEWISVDAYQRFVDRSYTLPYDRTGIQVGIVQESRDPKHPVGTRIVSHKGWCDYSVVKVGPLKTNDLTFVYKLPDLKGLSPSLGVGSVGMTGITAYFGFFDFCKPKAGETIVITGAAGAVGHIVGQLAKNNGLKVIGFAGSEEKVQWLEKEMGFDKAFNYKTVNIEDALKEAAPNGVDIYFDNVGGEISSKIMYKMNHYGRVAVCGSISSYDEPELPKVTILQPAILFRRLTVTGIVVWDWLERWTDAFGPLTDMFTKGQLKVVEHVTEGFENIPDAFVGMLKGANIGKAVVKV